jgi:malonyl-CoA O-methyltransferase
MRRGSSDEDRVAAAYNEWADVYDSDHNPTRDLDAAVLRRQSLDLPDSDVLELGCGTGKNTEWLARQSRSVLAMDFSEGMLQRARGRIHSRHVRFLAHDIRLPWPTPSEAYDVVVENLVLEHIADLGHFFREAARVLRPGGRLFVCELHPFRQLQGGVAKFQNPRTGETVQVSAHLHDISDFLRGGLKAGLKLVGADDWRDQGAVSTDPPRLFSALWEKAADV